MQTFLPYPDFARSAAVLDRQRLGKQRAEVLQLLAALTGARQGWANHPAARMWRGCEGRLAEYGLAICREWVGRGYRDTCADKIAALARELPPGSFSDPVWLGSPEFHAAHRSNLLRKDADWYGQQGWSEGPELEYVWP